MMFKRRIYEKTCAGVALAAAIAFAFTGLLLPQQGEITGNSCFIVAQLLTFAATLLGIDYKFNSAKND